jgi:hypothetical protein
MPVSSLRYRDPPSGDADFWGLSAEEAEVRLAEHGPNLLPAPQVPSL